MILSREKVLESIRNGEIAISPFTEEKLQLIDYPLMLEMPNPRILEKGDFAVIKTVEHIRLSPKIACFVMTRGSAAAKGMDAVQSSMLCDPATDNQITLEITNASLSPVELKHGMSIAKVIFVSVS